VRVVSLRFGLEENAEVFNPSRKSKSRLWRGFDQIQKAHEGVACAKIAVLSCLLPRSKPRLLLH
jgi:hypothetical protein